MLSNKEGGNPFNFTAIVLVKKDVDTGIQEIENKKWKIENYDGAVFDLQGHRMESSMLKKRMYIVNGKKVVIK